jgi:hypothetical protein
MLAVLYRKPEKGRDIFDVSFLTGLAAPDFAYIEKTVGMDQAEFLRRFEARLGELDLDSLARDVEPFLFAPEQRERVSGFRDFWKNQGKYLFRVSFM